MMFPQSVMKNQFFSPTNPITYEESAVYLHMAAPKIRPETKPRTQQDNILFNQP